MTVGWWQIGWDWQVWRLGTELFGNNRAWYLGPLWVMRVRRWMYRRSRRQ